MVIALLEDKRLMELHQEKHNNDFTVGDLYLGKVKRLAPGLNAAFVDVGYERDAFLHYFDLGPQGGNVQHFTRLTRNQKLQKGDLSKFDLLPDIDKGGNIKDVLKPGQEVLIQIAKEPISTKGPRISTELSIAGRYLVMVPFTNRISVSSKIKSRKEKDRLKRLITSIKPPGYGVIVRTVAENKRVADLDKDLRELIDKWEEGFENLRTTKPPFRVLGEMDRTSSLIRDLLNSEFNRIIIDDEKLASETTTLLETIAPDKAKIVKHYKGKVNIHDYYGVERQIKALFGRHVTMKTGAYLVIEHTEAMHVIDVNSGNTSKKDNSQEENALRVNMEAATEIARQLRVRDMGGIIVVDFIDMHQNENRQKLFKHMNDLMSVDRAKNYVLPPSKFGLVQITRQRVRPEMDIKTAETIPTKSGEDTEVGPTILLVDEIENHIIKQLSEKQQISEVKVHPFVAAYFNQHRLKYQLKWFWKFKKWVPVSSRTAYPLMRYKILNKEGELLVAANV